MNLFLWESRPEGREGEGACLVNKESDSGQENLYAVHLIGRRGEYEVKRRRRNLDIKG